jgi:alpha-D-xyloside xylohydrolase
VPPPSELELVKWRDVNTGPGEVLEDISRLRAAGVPLGWMLVDNPWETCNGTLTFDRTRFPDPAGLIREVHARGLRFMLWISPKVTCGAGYPPNAALGTDDRTLDLRRPAVVREFQQRLRRLRALGVDGVKGDRGDEVDVEAIDPTLQNRYPLLFAQSSLAVWPNGGAIFRAGAMGSQSIAPGIWAGDQTGDWNGLQRAIRSAETAAMSGFPTWGSDVGGYSSEQVTAEVFIRWAQLGAVSPVLEVGGVGANATPWVLGPDAMSALRDAAVLHYELFPYMYGLLRRDEPVLRPLAYGYPDDPQVWHTDLELLVGPDLLAAPVAGPGTTPAVYLPGGRWVDLYSGATVAGGGPSFTRETPMSQFPLYARAGAVIPFNLRTSTGSWWGVDEQTHPGRAGFLATDGATLALSGQPRDVQIFVPAPSRPRAVTIGGRAVAWSWNAGPLPGVVIRLHGPVVAGKVSLRRA